MKQIVASIVIVTYCCSCGRVDVYYPSDGKSVVVDDKGRPHRAHNRAVVLNGADALGNTSIEVHRDGVRLASAGGLDTSTTTIGWQRTIRFGIAAAAWAAGAVGVANTAANAYNANQGASATSNVAASRAGSAAAVSRNATQIRLAEIAAGERAAAAAQAAQAAAAARAIPAAGSTIPSIIPSVVTPVAP
jgi:hypothetical protein